MLPQILKFGLVGALATLVHMVIGVILIQSGWQPVRANAAAFSTAFVVSFIGHLGYSFADQEPRLASALWKFTFVALAGFMFNELLMTILLRMKLIPAVAVLCVSTACAAVLTFVLSRYWAFQRSGQQQVPAPDGVFTGDD